MTPNISNFLVNFKPMFNRIPVFRKQQTISQIAAGRVLVMLSFEGNQDCVLCSDVTTACSDDTTA